MVHEEKLATVVKALKENKPVIVCGPFQSGKTTLANKGAAQVEPRAKKSGLVYLDDLATGDRLADRLAEKKPTVVVIDEVASSTLAVADEVVKTARNLGARIIATVNIGQQKGNVNGEAVRARLAGEAERSGKGAIAQVLREAEVVTLPDAEWERVEVAGGAMLKTRSRLFHRDEL